MHAAQQIINPPAVGVIFSENHALNIIAATNNQFYLIDTMTASSTLRGIGDNDACYDLLRHTNVMLK